MTNFELVEDRAKKLMFWESVSDRLENNKRPFRHPGVMVSQGIGLALNYVAQEFIAVPLKVRRKQFLSAASNELGAIASHHVSGPIPYEFSHPERPHAERDFLQLPDGQGTVSPYDYAKDLLASVASRGDGAATPPISEA